MDLLAAHIPLTLLLDLAENFGPPSQEILQSEAATSDPADTSRTPAPVSDDESLPKTPWPRTGSHDSAGAPDLRKEADSAVRPSSAGSPADAPIEA